MEDSWLPINIILTVVKNMYFFKNCLTNPQNTNSSSFRVLCNSSSHKRTLCVEFVLFLCFLLMCRYPKGRVVWVKLTTIRDFNNSFHYFMATEETATRKTNQTTKAHTLSLKGRTTFDLVTKAKTSLEATARESLKINRIRGPWWPQHLEGWGRRASRPRTTLSVRFFVPEEYNQLLRPPKITQTRNTLTPPLEGQFIRASGGWDSAAGSSYGVC